MRLRGTFVASILLLVASAGAQTAKTPGGLPHADNPVLQNEHVRMLDLIRDSDLTDRAIKTGDWSAPVTWKSGSVPAAGAIIAIPQGITVTLSSAPAAAIRSVRVDGKLQFAADRDTSISLDTLLVTPGGELIIGTAQAPIAPQCHARILFTDSGPIDLSRDPLQLGRGLISHGTVSIHGTQVTPFVSLAQSAHAGDARLILSREPIGWKAGDHLLLPGTTLDGNEDDLLTVAGVHGNEVTTGPLRFDHLSPAADLPVQLANLTRNVSFSSQAQSKPGAAGRCGHVMFMHSPRVEIAYAAFENLGRTDKSRIIDDPQLDAQGQLIAGSGINPRGRYAVHFHRTGIAAGSQPARVVGSVVVNGAGWGFVNHSSNVIFEDNICFNVFGSAFVTEAGDEIGAFRRNLAVRSAGSGEGEDVRKKAQDFAHEGDGFWFQGPGIAVEDNVAAGQAASGFIYFTEGLRQEGLGTTRFPVANFADASWAGKIAAVDPKDPDKISDPSSVPVIAVPIHNFKGNTAYACNVGYTVRFHRGSPGAAQSVLEDSIAWNTAYGAKVRYTSHLVLRNLRLEGGFSKHAICGVDGTLEGEQDIHYENLSVGGWPCGIHVPEAGHHFIVAGNWNNITSILIPTPYSRNRHVEISGNVCFGTLPPQILAGRPQYDIEMQAAFAPLLNGGYRDPNVLFADDQTLIDFGDYRGKQIYYLEQAADRVPFDLPANLSPEERKRLGQAKDVLPVELIGKSNGQMYSAYHLSIGGALAPADAISPPRIHGLIGSITHYSPERIPTPARTPRLHDFSPTLLLADAGKKSALQAAPVDLHPGWNLVSQPVEGQLQSFLIFGGDESKPAAKPSKY